MAARSRSPVSLREMLFWAVVSHGVPLARVARSASPVHAADGLSGKAATRRDRGSDVFALRVVANHRRWRIGGYGRRRRHRLRDAPADLDRFLECSRGSFVPPPCVLKRFDLRGGLRAVTLNATMGGLRGDGVCAALGKNLFDLGVRAGDDVY